MKITLANKYTVEIFVNDIKIRITNVNGSIRIWKFWSWADRYDQCIELTISELNEFGIVIESE